MPSNQKIAMSTRTAPLPCSVTDHERVAMSGTVSPFEITGFRTEKFENHEEDSSKVDQCVDSPAARKLLERIHEAALQCRIK